MSKIEHITLTELQNEIKAGIEGAVPAKVWVSAEISDITNHASGHCYLSLVDKPDDAESDISSKANGIIWSTTYRLLKPYFESTTGRALEIGMKVKVKVSIQYSVLYGLSLIISDIDPSFSVGELETQKIKVITRLKEEGMFDMNTSLELPRIIKRIAVISSESAAGYRDFVNHLFGNEYGFKFSLALYPALMQGPESPGSIISALDLLLPNISEFDVVVILRGGGAAFDLICFDDYDLAANIAQFPIPIITAIGHDHDYHVADMVANTFVKTPTALADWFIEMYIAEDMMISSFATRLLRAAEGKYNNAQNHLSTLLKHLGYITGTRWIREYSRLDVLEKSIKGADPLTLLERGFMIILKDGKRVNSVEDVEKRDIIEILFKDGKATAEVGDISPSSSI